MHGTQPLGAGTVDIDGPAGRLEGLLYAPTTTPTGAIVFAHPHPMHGGSMHTKVVFQAARGLADAGFAVLRFNFRGVGRSEGVFHGDAGEQADFEAALEHVATLFPGTPLWAGGFSFGSWIGLTVGARDPRVTALVGIGLPADRYDFEAVVNGRKPTFLIHGEEDDVCPLQAVRLLYGRLAEPKELVVIDDADHLFDGRTLEIREVVGGLLRDAADLSPEKAEVPEP